ncbi:MAG TPA: 50S ribosomal protein L9 [Rhizobiales bacterium]|nr:50S ribosomal protein L9 [bacterium BMS3Bbin10]HDO52191.1 50S ribosomal protein L9 [Hyphomicrobiales bacterium]
MQVILLERIGKLGQMGDTVTVKDGYARNYLLPQGKALRASETNKLRFEQDRVQLEARNLELKKEADSVAEKLNGQIFIAIRQAGDTGQLYGSVSTRDIAAIVTEAGYSISRNQAQLDTAIKNLGLHPVSITLHPEVIVSVTVNVARSEEEARRQARGEDVTAQDDDFEDQDAISTEEVFEDEELSKQAEEALEAEADLDSAETSAQESGADSGDTSRDAAKDEPDEEAAGKED